MKFEFELENIQFYVELVENKTYHPHHITNPMSKQETLELEAGEFGFFDLYISSSRGEESLKHYKPALALSYDLEEVQQELEELLFEENLLEPVLKHWNYVDNIDGPEWKKSE